MPLDPNVKQFIANYQSKKHPPYASFAPAELREWFNQGFKQKEQPEKIAVAKVIERQVEGPDGLLTFRIFYPEGNGPFPALMYFHGGGFVIRNDMDIYDQTCRMMCQRAGCIVIAVDFRLAPEHPFPAAPEDCYASTCWVAQHAAELNIDSTRLGVWGESCGGNLATVVAMMARDREGPSLKCQIIITAMLDYSFNTVSYHDNGQGDYMLSKDSMQWFWNHYLSQKSDANNPYCAPCVSTQLEDLPPALVVTVEYDPLCDEGFQYAEQLKSQQVVTDYRCYPGLIHGFFDLYAISEAANQACNDIIATTKVMLNQL